MSFARDGCPGTGGPHRPLPGDAGRQRCRTPAVASAGVLAESVRSSLERQPARAACLGAGLALFATNVTMIWLDQIRDPLAVWTFAFALCLTVLAVAPGFLKRFRVSPASGIDMDFVDIRSPDVAFDVRNIASEAIGRARPVDQLLDDEANALEFFRLEGADSALRRVLTGAGGPLEGCTLHLYLWDEDLQALAPAFEDGDAETWASGVGVVGTAYSTGNFAYAEGDATHDDTFNLPIDRQSTHSDLVSCAAMPITNWSNHQIAVLSMSNHDQERVLDDGAVFAEMAFLSQIIARILIDLLGWFTDE